MDIEESVAYLGESVRSELFSAASWIFLGLEKVKSFKNLRYYHKTRQAFRCFHLHQAGK